MKLNKKGFTLIELLAVIVILAVIALISSPIILGIIEDTRESARVRSVEGYMDAVESTITTYMALNANSTVSSICSNACNATCQIDGTPAAKKNGTVSTGCTTAKKAVTYSGDDVKCDTVSYSAANGTLTLTNCTVGSDTTHKYSGNNKDGIELNTR